MEYYYRTSRHEIFAPVGEFVIDVFRAISEHLQLDGYDTAYYIKPGEVDEIHVLKRGWLFEGGVHSVVLYRVSPSSVVIYENILKTENGFTEKYLANPICVDLVDPKSITVIDDYVKAAMCC